MKLFSASRVLFRYISIRRVHSEVRVRFAPSPTGHLHLGSLRTALCNYLFAKKENGTFILRIEDTDAKRTIPEAIRCMQEILTWSGIIPDEGPDFGGSYGPYIQSQRLHLYRKAAEELVEKDFAYRCFCTERQLQLRRKEALRNQVATGYDNRCRSLSELEIQEKLEMGKPYVIRFKLENKPVTFHDLFHGSITSNIADYEGDPVILKSDGCPTYHLANVVDDHLMCVSHVLRGVEWKTSTSKHIQMYNAFSWSPPIFAHLPLILNSDGTKLSKRQNDIHIQHLKDAGYFPEAVVNFVAHIGVGFDEKPLAVSLPELITKFNLEEINSKLCGMQESLLDKFNQQLFVKFLDDPTKTKELITQIKKLIQKHPINSESINDDYIKRILRYYKDENMNFKLSELSNADNAYLWSQPVLKVSDVWCPDYEAVRLLTTFSNELQSCSKDTTEENILSLLKDICKKQEVKFADCMKLLRKILCGVKEGLPIVHVISLIGIEETISRLQNAIKLLETDKMYSASKS